MKKLVDVKTAQICLEEVPQHEIDNLARATLRAIERYFEIPENKAKYEQWLAERNANKVQRDYNYEKLQLSIQKM